MASLGGVFDATAPENQSQNSILPAGDYEVIAIASEVKQTKDGSGRFLSYQFQVTKGEYQNRRIFQRFNLWSQSEKAVAIARGQYSEFCRAVGVLTPEDSSDLHNKPLLIKVKVRADTGYGEQNDIAKFAKRPGEAPVVQQSTGGGW